MRMKKYRYIKFVLLAVVIATCFTFYLKHVYWDDPMIFIKYAKPEDLQNPYIHKHQYPYTINNEHLCNGTVFLLIFVPSDPQKVLQRQLVRHTWGAVKQIADKRIVTVFGTAQRVIQVNSSKTKEINAALKAESEEYHDIVQADFIDSYENLTYKSVMALHWVVNYCRNAKFFLKVDDDVIPNLFKYIKLLLSSVSRLKVIFCHPNNSDPHRPNSTALKKWQVSRSDYFPNNYPTYCAGPSYMMSIDILFKMYKTTKIVPFLFLEDVYLGLCRKHAGIGISTIDYVVKRKEYLKLENNLAASFFIMKKSDSLTQWQSLWQQIVSTFNTTNAIYTA